MEFTWLAFNLIDIGAVSIGVVALWLQKKRADRITKELKESEAQRHRDKVAHDNFKAESEHRHAESEHRYRELQSTSDRRYTTLRGEHDTLRGGT